MKEFDMNLMLEPVLANVVKSLAEFFGTTTEVIMANAPKFLAEYGWYYSLTNLPYLLISIAIFGIGGGILAANCFSGKKQIVIFLLVFIIVTTGILACNFLPVIIAPELVGLDHLIYAITGNNVI